MHEYPGEIHGSCHFQEGVKVSDVAMHPTVGEKADQVKLTAPFRARFMASCRTGLLANVPFSTARLILVRS